jgi:hypothetical protein
MFKLHRVLTSIAVLLAASGCATSSVDKDFSLAEHPKDGVVVVSVSLDSDVLGNSNAIFYWDDGRPNSLQGRLESRAESIPGIYKPSEFEGVVGRLYAFNLPEGEYRISSWMVQAGGGRMAQTRTNEPEPLPFRVKAGEVKYIGNFHAHLEFANLGGILPVLADASPEIKDERARDIALFQKKFPRLGDKVLVDLVSVGAWAPSSEQLK